MQIHKIITKCVSSICVVVFCAGCQLQVPVQAEVNYLAELTATINGKQVHGEGVLQAVIYTEWLVFPQAQYHTRAHGDAIRLGVEGRNVYALLRPRIGASNHNYPVLPLDTQCDYVDPRVRGVKEAILAFAHASGSCIIDNANNRFLIIEIPDPTDPESILVLNGGPVCQNTCIDKIKIEITDLPVTRWVAAEFVWLRLQDGHLSVAGSGHAVDSNIWSAGSPQSLPHNTDFSK
jgi:hypothetical protein